MNFKPDNEVFGVKYIWVHVHSKKIIIKCDDQVNLFEHNELYTKVEKFIEPYFAKNRLEYIIKYLADNLELLGIVVKKIKKSKDKPSDNQLSLF